MDDSHLYMFVKKLIQVIMYVYKHKTLSNICMKFYFPEVLMMNKVQL